jgi:hypothetical protein
LFINKAQGQKIPYLSNIITRKPNKFADNSPVTTEAKGKVLIQRRNGKQSYKTDVLYVPQMKNNL